ncbi:MAG: T9SS type A sorting domain-containing protein [Bacteroidales bacterium]|nr:T9SS type A sorting domain-containing protein [Bacteroidales bacterium]MBN2764640.1 T9SS type A sorting domain-containing protein [Bacteroidales bacterium]
MKKIVPFLIMILLLTSMRFNDSIARLFEQDNLETVFVDMNGEIPELVVSVYPNPVHDGKINIITSQHIKSIKLLTIVGSVVFDEEYVAGITSVQLDLDKLNKGLYLLKVEFSKENIYTEKIMVK